MRYDDDDTTLGLEKAKRGQRAPRGRRSRGGRRWTGTLSQRARTSRRLPQVVFKISSYSHGGGALWDRVNYVARDGEQELEGPNGEQIENQAELEQIVDKWSREVVEGERKRVAMSAVVSFPAGVDQEQATEAARQFFREAFAENHDYVFAPHTDAKQFHVHVIVETRGLDGEQLRLNRDDIQDLRMLFAEKAREQGIELDASPRWARGLDAERGPSREVEGMERRGATPGWSREREPEGLEAPTARAALAEERIRRAQEPGTEECQALEYARAAAGVAGQISELETDRDRVAAVKAAVSLARFGWDLVQEGRETAEDSEQAREIIDTAERAVRDSISRIADKEAKREAIQARQSLYHAGVKEYRAEKREQERQQEAAQREYDGPELELER